MNQIESLKEQLQAKETGNFSELKMRLQVNTYNAISSACNTIIYCQRRLDTDSFLHVNKPILAINDLTLHPRVNAASSSICLAICPLFEGPAERFGKSISR